jgi:hypothetical protein
VVLINVVLYPILEILGKESTDGSAESALRKRSINNKYSNYIVENLAEETQKKGYNN